MVINLETHLSVACGKCTRGEKGGDRVCCQKLKIDIVLGNNKHRGIHERNKEKLSNYIDGKEFSCR